MKNKRKRITPKNKAWQAFLTVVFFWVSAICLSTIPVLQAQDSGVDGEYEVSVSAHLIPFYAENAKGEPIFDLKQDEIELLVNKKTVDLMGLSRFQYDISDTPLPAGASGKEALELKQKIREQQRRYVFIVVDAIFNYSYGVKRADAICRRIIKDCPDTDAFILMANMPDKGLTYVAGPTDNRQLLNQGLSVLSQKGLEAIQIQKKRFKNYGGGIIRKRLSGPSVINAAGTKGVFNLDAEEMWNSRRETRTIKRGRAHMLTSSLGQLRYALKTISRPKIVYFISAGVPGGLMGSEESSSYHRHLKKAAQLINDSGTILYVVNSFVELPGLYAQASGEDMLKQLAQGGNGKYFSGKSVQKIATQIHNSTAAYYELAFAPNGNNGMAIEINCKRPGVKIFSVSHTEKARPYREMKKLQKRLFALNVVTRGTWSRMVGEVGVVPVAKTNNYAKKMVGVEVQLPEKMRNRNLDIYTINLDPQTMKADFEAKSVSAGETIEIKGKQKNKRKLFFVIIDPKTTTCIYNKMI